MRTLRQIKIYFKRRNAKLLRVEGKVRKTIGVWL